MISGKMYRFTADPRHMDPRFLELYLLSPGAQRQIDQMKTGISDSGLNLTKDRFLALPVPIAPIAEQRRIVDILEDHLSRLDAAESAMESGRRKAGVLESTILDHYIWAQENPLAPVEDLLSAPLRNGHSARATSGPGIRTLTLTAVTRRAFTDEFTKITVAAPDRVRDLWLEPGDILVQRSNTPELVGSTAIYNGPREWAIFPDLMIRLRADSSRVSSEYLCLAVQSERGHRVLRSKAKGLAGSMPKIDQEAIGSLRVPVPDATTQAEVVSRSAEASLALTRLDQASRNASARGASLRRALLVAAFTGRLTGRSSDFDHAEELTAP